MGEEEKTESSERETLKRREDCLRPTALTVSNNLLLADCEDNKVVFRTFRYRFAGWSILHRSQMPCGLKERQKLSRFSHFYERTKMRQLDGSAAAFRDKD